MENGFIEPFRAVRPVGDGSTQLGVIEFDIPEKFIFVALVAI